jgi:hypothetical protein
VASLLYYFNSDLDLNTSSWISAIASGYFFRPVIMALITLLILYVVIIIFKHTKHGYRYGNLKIILVILSVAGLLSVLFLTTGWTRKIDGGFAKIPGYQNREAFMKEMWQRPADGRLSGEITAITDQGFVLRDFDGQEWTVLADNAIWRHDLTASVGLKIKLLGAVLPDSEFKADDIRPWLPPAGTCQMNHGSRSDRPGCGR